MSRHQLCNFDVLRTAINTALRNWISTVNLLSFQGLCCLMASFFEGDKFRPEILIPPEWGHQTRWVGKTSHFLVLNIKILKTVRATSKVSISG